MPTIEVPVPAYTTIEVEIDLQDHLSEIEVDIDDDAVCEAINSGEIDLQTVLEAVGSAAIVEHIDEGNIEIPDQTLLKLIEGRDDLVKLGLSGDMTVEEQAQQLYDRLFTAGGTTQAKRTIRLLVRHLCRDAPFRGAVTDALGEHYVKAPPESLVPVQIEDAEVVAEAAK